MVCYLVLTSMDHVRKEGFTVTYMTCKWAWHELAKNTAWNRWMAIMSGCVATFPKHFDSGTTFVIGASLGIAHSWFERWWLEISLEYEDLNMLNNPKLFKMNMLSYSLYDFKSAVISVWSSRVRSTQVSIQYPVKCTLTPLPIWNHMYL